MKRQRTVITIVLISVFFIAVSCVSSPSKSDIPTELHPENTTEILELTFAGDIMAHTVNYRMADYNSIYDDTRSLLKADDLSFANLEIPVADTLPESTYPRFNVHTPYVLAAIDGGFDVFSLANNHSNDQGTTGIKETLTFMSSLNGRINSSGLRFVADEPMKPVIIEKKGWKIMFLAVTEILNSYDSTGKLVYYSPPNATGREKLLADLARMRTENPCDVFVLSIHLNEPEYVRTVGTAKKEYFVRLAEAGVDIVWGHHPHVMQTWDTAIRGTSGRQALFMYSTGNYISGQRYTPDRNVPDALREYTGDAVLLRVTLSRTPRNMHSSSGALMPPVAYGYDRLEVRPVLITNWTDPNQGPVVRFLDQRFLFELSQSWLNYYQARQKLMEEYLPLYLQPNPVILEK